MISASSILPTRWIREEIDSTAIKIPNTFQMGVKNDVSFDFVDCFLVGLIVTPAVNVSVVSLNLAY